MISLNQNNFLKHEVDVNPSFDIENAHRDRIAKMNSLWITLTIHGLLLLLFLFLVLNPPFPPLSESGVFLNLGLVEVGSGNVQPQGNEEELKAPTPAASSPASEQKNEKILTQETKEDVPVIRKKETQKKNPAPVKNETKSTPTKKNPPAESPPQPKAKALYPGTQANNSTSEGTGNAKGDQGKPNGDVKGTDYSGNPGIGTGGKGGLGNGGAPQLGMSGRKIIFFPTILDNSQKTGRVVVNIKVDKQGNVIWAKATQKGSTTTDSFLFQLAEDAALKTKVNDDPNAAEEQFGTITYSFKVK